MVNYWWGDAATGVESPNTVFLAALLALKQLPPGERAYWRAMFATHVFGDPDVSAAHIPMALRGALGPMRPHERAALRPPLTAASRASPSSPQSDRPHSPARKRAVSGKWWSARVDDRDHR